MKHARIATAPVEDSTEKCSEIELPSGTKVCLVEEEYSPEQLEQFEVEAPKWIVERKGTRFFLAESDSGEDAEAYYCGYFDLEPEFAVFDEGKFIGFYLCTPGMRYSGRGRYNFAIDDWGFPGQSIFDFIRSGSKTFLFLFADAETHSQDEWTLLVRDPEAKYEWYLDF